MIISSRKNRFEKKMSFGEDVNSSCLVELSGFIFFFYTTFKELFKVEINPENLLEHCESSRIFLMELFKIQKLDSRIKKLTSFDEKTVYEKLEILVASCQESLSSAAIKEKIKQDPSKYRLKHRFTLNECFIWHYGSTPVIYQQDPNSVWSIRTRSVEEFELFISNSKMSLQNLEYFNQVLTELRLEQVRLEKKQRLEILKAARIEKNKALLEHLTDRPRRSSRNVVSYKEPVMVSFINCSFEGCFFTGAFNIRH